MLYYIILYYIILDWVRLYNLTNSQYISLISLLPSLLCAISESRRSENAPTCPHLLTFILYLDLECSQYISLPSPITSYLQLKPNLEMIKI